ncbi:hypothetical protein REH81_03995 [Vibrio rotiferianus]
MALSYLYNLTNWNVDMQQKFNANTENRFVVTLSINCEFTDRVIIETDGKEPSQAVIDKMVASHIKMNWHPYSNEVVSVQTMEEALKALFVDLGKA